MYIYSKIYLSGHFCAPPAFKGLALRGTILWIICPHVVAHPRHPLLSCLTINPTTHHPYPYVSGLKGHSVSKEPNSIQSTVRPRYARIPSLKSTPYSDLPSRHYPSKR